MLLIGGYEAHVETDNINYLQYIEIVQLSFFERCISCGALMAVFQRVQSVPSRALLASTASTAARTAPVVMADCATTSRDSASAQLASAGAGTQLWQAHCWISMHKILL